jgi:xanthine dehydrogenase YagS FAD-binding subunit
MRNFAFDTATTVQVAAGAASLVCEAMLTPDGGAGSPETTLVKAGGIDLLDLMKEGLVAPAKVTSLSGVAGLGAVEPQSDGGLRIGALVTLARLAADETVRKAYPPLADAAGASASPEIRNAATLGGNLLQRPRCWYFRAAEFRCLRKGGGHCFAIDGENQHHAIFDNRFCAIVHPSTSASALLALGAEVELVDRDGATRRLALEDFFVGPDKDVQRENDLRAHEILTAVLLPSAVGLRMTHLKLSQKQLFDWPLVDVAVALDIGPDGACRRASIALGAVAPTPRRARAAEDALTGKIVDAQSAAVAGRAALDGATPLSKNAYKAPMLEALVRRALLRAAGQA